MSYTTLTVSVPAGREPELLKFAASLAQPSGDEVSPEVASPGIDAKSIKDAYFGGVSKVWRPFLHYLAARPDEWVAWPDLYKHINRTASEASGMLGAAERRCGDHVPYEKVWRGKVRYFRMAESVATLIAGLDEE